MPITSRNIKPVPARPLADVAKSLARRMRAKKNGSGFDAEAHFGGHLFPRLLQSDTPLWIRCPVVALLSGAKKATPKLSLPF